MQICNHKTASPVAWENTDEVDQATHDRRLGDGQAEEPFKKAMISEVKQAGETKGRFKNKQTNKQTPG